MKIRFSILNLLLWTFVVGLVASLFVTTRRLTLSEAENHRLKSDLRSQIQNRAYNTTGRFIVRHQKTIVYALKTESTFCHTIRLICANTEQKQIIVRSYVHAHSNLWTTELFVCAIRTDESVEYALSKSAEYANETPTSVVNIKNDNTSMESFSSTGELSEEWKIPIWRAGPEPFEVWLTEEMDVKHRSSEEILTLN